MDQTIYIEHKLKDGHILQLFQDSWAESPRTWDNLGTMAIFHKRYNFGDEVDFTADDFGGWGEMQKHIIKNLNAALCIPIYMYEHSGITISCDSFSCPWDSGQIGFIYVTKEKLRKEYNVKNITAEVMKKAENCLKHEIKIMDQYVQGNVYGFQIIDKNEHIIDSCSGFYGKNIFENGMLDYIDSNLIDTL